MTNESNTRLRERFKDILRRESEAVAAIPLSDSFAKAVEMILQAVHSNGGKLITAGMGKAGQIAMNIATTFCSTGTPAVFLHPSEAQHGDLGILQDKDLLLLLSNSGKTREILELVELVKAMHPKVPFIVVTGDDKSPLASLADVTLFTGNPPEVCPLGLTPTTSTTMMTVIGDLLVVGVMEEIGFTVSEYAKRHHGGYLGHKSKETIKNICEYNNSPSTSGHSKPNNL